MPATQVAYLGNLKGVPFSIGKKLSIIEEFDITLNNQIIGFGFDIDYFFLEKLIFSTMKSIFSRP
jgi:hypothetical protein